MTEVPITEFSQLTVDQSMDWFLYDRDLRHERVKQPRYFICYLKCFKDW